MKERKFDQRKVAIIIAVILGFIVALYLGGVAGQLHANYQQWAEDGGMTGDAKMRPLKMSPMDAIPFVFTAGGIKGLLFVIVVAGGIFLYIKLHDKFSGKDFDHRNFTRSKSGTYGTAGWMDDKEMRQILEVAAPEKARGVILGQKNSSVVCLPPDTRLNRHIAVMGSTGSMKSRAIFRNVLFQAIRRGESVICSDPKSELYADTAELFRRRGYTVKIFNLIQPEYGDSWNCMADLNGDTMMAQVLTDVIIRNTSEGKGDHFWDNGEGNLLKALVLFVDQEASRGLEHKHLPAVYQLLTNNTEKQLTTMFAKLPLSHPARAPYNLFAQASDTVRAGIVLGLGTRLQVLQNEAVQKIISRSDIDLAEPGKSKCAYFVILSDQESATDFISSLFFSFLFIKLVRYADNQPNGECSVPVNIVLDEGNNIGAIPDFARKLSTIRSRRLAVIYGAQNIPQCQNRYPDKEWAEIMGAMDIQLMLGCTDDVTAEYFSLRSGDMTVEVNSTMTVRQSIAIAQVIPQYRHTEGLGRRRLLTPDEVLRMPADELLIILRGQKVLKVNKFDYTSHPMAKRIVRTPIYEYVPTQHASPASLHQTEPDDIPTPQTESIKNKQRSEAIAQPAAGSSLYKSAKPPDEF